VSVRLRKSGHSPIRPPSVNWRYQEIVVTQDYLNQNNGLFIKIDQPYRMGIKALHVYYNGQRLTEGGGYEEIDDTTIRLDLGIDVYTGLTNTLVLEDEIIIMEWFNLENSGESGLNRMYQEILVTKEYLDQDNGLFVKLNEPYTIGIKALHVYYNGQLLTEGGGYEEYDETTIRLDLGFDDWTNEPHQLKINDEIVIIQWFDSLGGFGGGGATNTYKINNRVRELERKMTSVLKELEFLLSHSDYTIEYDYDNENIIKETYRTSTNTITKEYVYNFLGKPTIEVIYNNEKTTTRTFDYNEDGFITNIISFTVVA
jgi:hypothetical protein